MPEVFYRSRSEQCAVVVFLTGELRTLRPGEVSFMAKLIEDVLLYALTASLLEDQLSMGAFRNFYTEKTLTVR